MPEIGTTFRIEIDGDWSALEMSDQFRSLRQIHGVFYLASLLYRLKAAPSRNILNYLLWPQQHNKMGSDDFLAKMLEEHAGVGTDLQIARIQFSSPGFQDFFGIAKVVQELLSFLRGIIKISSELRKDDLNAQEHEQKILKLKLENLASFIKVLRDAGASEDDIKLALNNLSPMQDVLIKLAVDGKIVSARAAKVDQAA